LTHKEPDDKIESSNCKTGKMYRHSVNRQSLTCKVKKFESSNSSRISVHKIQQHRNSQYNILCLSP